MLEARPYKWLWMPATWLMTWLVPAFLAAFAHTGGLIDEAAYRGAGPVLIGLTPLISATALVKAAAAAKAGGLTRLRVIGLFCGMGLSCGLAIFLFFGMMGLFFAILFGLHAGTDAGTTTVQFLKLMATQSTGLISTMATALFAGAVVGSIAAFTAFRRIPVPTPSAPEDDVVLTVPSGRVAPVFGQRRR